MDTKSNLNSILRATDRGRYGADMLKLTRRKKKGIFLLKQLMRGHFEHNAVDNHPDGDGSFLWEGGAVSQTPQIDSLDNLICLRCRVAMSVTCASEEYPGYQRRVFECPVCGKTITQWAGVSLASSGAETGEPLGRSNQ